MKIWLDDERPAPDGWEWAKNHADFLALIQYPPEIDAVSFDHDMGDGWPSGYDSARSLLKRLIEWDLPLPPFTEIHSQNPVGAARIRELLEDYERTYHFNHDEIANFFSSDE